MKALIASCIAVLVSCCAEAEPPMLQPARRILAGGTDLNPGSQAIPCVADWNGDGLPDLILGYQPAFKIAVFLNSGTASEPVFSTFTNIQAGGADIYMPAGGCGSPAPWVCDYDGDGRRDLLVGAGEDGKVWFYRNTNTDSTPILASGVSLLKGGVDLTVGIRATPYTHDWDEDGLPDLLCGDGNGYVHFFRNVGTRAAPVYAADVLIQAGGAALKLGYRSVVRICDWDGDGLKDLVGSGSDNAAWCRNTGRNSAPVLAGAVRLQSPAPNVGLANIDTGYRMRLEVVDWNHDGVLDLLIGNWDGYTYLYEGYRFALSSPACETGNRCGIGWHSAPYLKYDVLAGQTPQMVTNLAKSGLASEGTRTGWTNVVVEGRQFYRVRIAP